MGLDQSPPLRGKFVVLGLEVAFPFQYHWQHKHYRLDKILSDHFLQVSGFQTFTQINSKRITICPKTITLQQLSFGQFISATVTYRLHRRNCLGFILWAP